jgi:tetratricopeptide (TPR) repeat protein
VAAQLRSLAGSVSAPSVAAPIVLDDGPTRRGAPTPSSDAPAAHHGRELEVAQLLDMIDAAQAARELRGLLVTAPPGMGKSWLLDSAATRAALGGATVLRAACTEAVNDLRVLAPWVRRVGDHARLVELLGEHHADLVVHVTGVEAGGSVEADPATIADAMAALVGACERPVAVVDDLHHAADDLVDLLGRLAFRPGIAGALWLGARPGFVDGDDLDVRTLALGPLPDDVIVDLAGAEAVELAGGNPLLARELLLARALAPELATELAPALAPLHAATTDVRELIGQRLARVGSAAGAELDLAATCGEVFWPETIGVTMALGLMCRSGLVRLRPDSTIAGSTEAEWTHPLLREVAYDRLDDGTRRDAHVKVAHKLDDAATEPEAIAHHAAAAFELGARDESAFVGDVSSRAARVALDRFALANADRWTSLVRETGHEPVPGTADTLEAELLLRRGEFERSGTLADRWTERADDVGTQALAVSAEAHLATGEYDTAEHAAAAALARIPDSRRRDQLTSTYVELLKRRGDYEQAANLAAAAASAARSRGDGAYAARLAVQAATNDVYAANARGAPIIEHVWRSFDALRELQGAGDRRAYVDAAFATATLVAVVDPAAARSLLDDAIDDAEALGAATQLGSLAIHASEIAFELGDVPGARVYAERASRQPLERLQRVYLDSLSASIEIANGSDAPDLLNRVIVAADDPLCDYPTRMFGLTVPMWTGQIASVKRDRFVGDGVIDAIADLSYIALLGPPWAAAFNGTHPPGAANELALLHYLRGEHDAGDALLRTRAAFLTASGSSYERFNVVFPGPLLMALGPPDIAPRVDWLVEQILRPALRNLWAIHRAICAALLAERQHEQARELASAGLAILDRAKPDPVVSTWLTERLGRAFDQ